MCALDRMYARFDVKRAEIPVEIVVRMLRYAVKAIWDYSQMDRRGLKFGAVVEEVKRVRRGRGGYEVT